MRNNYKISIYTSRIVLGTRIFLYNSLSDNILMLHPSIDELIQKNLFSIDNIKQIHPELFIELYHKGFIVRFDVIESDSVEKEWDSQSNDESKFTLIVNPTISCNMRCWYCYETHLPSTIMSDSVFNNLKKFTTKKITNKSLLGFNLDFFGGEPLLVYNQCTKQIISHVYEECLKYNKQFFLSFTTNGYLLSEDILLDFDKWSMDGPIKLQITLDGNSECHNMTRKLGGKLPTYDKILSNIQKSLYHNVDILLRLNYTDDNVNSFYDVIDDLSSISEEHKKKIIISFHRVWQNKDSLLLKTEVTKVIEAFENSGFAVENTFVASKNRCYGDQNNTIVVNYDGDIYKCTARDFNKTNCEGFLNSNGDVEWNSRHDERITASKKFKNCKKCRIYPICHVGCSQNRLEWNDTDECVKGYSEETKDYIIREIIEFNLKAYQNNE